MHRMALRRMTRMVVEQPVAAALGDEEAPVFQGQGQVADTARRQQAVGDVAEGGDEQVATVVAGKVPAPQQRDQRDQRRGLGHDDQPGDARGLVRAPDPPRGAERKLVADEDPEKDG